MTRPKGRRAVVDRLACHDRVGTVLRQSEHVGDRRDVVLAVGVDLEAVAETRRAGKPEACEDGGALAAIDVEAASPARRAPARRARRAPCVPAARCRHRSRRRPAPGHAAVRRWPASLASGCGSGSRRRRECLLPSCAAACRPFPMRRPYSRCRYSNCTRPPERRRSTSVTSASGCSTRRNLVWIFAAPSASKARCRAEKRTTQSSEADARHDGQAGEVAGQRRQVGIDAQVELDTLRRLSAGEHARLHFR